MSSTAKWSTEILTCRCDPLSSSVRVALIAVIVCAALASACTSASPESLIRSAERHVAEREYRTALIELRNAIQMAPDNSSAQRLLGVVLLAEGDPTAAEKALRDALAMGEPLGNVLPSLALALLRQGQADRLIREFESRRLEEPVADASLQASIGQAGLLQGDIPRAEVAFTAALERVPHHPKASLGQARIAGHVGRLEDATRMVDVVLAANPGLAEAHAFKAELLLSQGQRADAIQSLVRALGADAADVPTRAELASLYIFDQQFDKAQALLVVDSHTAGVDPRLIYLRGLLALHRGNLQGARDEANRILRHAPDHGPSLLLAGEVEFRSNNLPLAESYTLNALRSTPRVPGASRLLAAIHLRRGQPAKAVDVLQPLLHVGTPPDAALALLAGEAYLASGDLVRAAELFESSKARLAGDSFSRLRLGQIALARGDWDRGVAELQDASALQAKHHQADLLLIALHLRRHQPKLAIEAAEALIRKRPSEALGYVLAGTAHLAAQEPALARRRFDVALKIQPDHLPALRAMANLDLADGRNSDTKARYEALLAKRPNDEQLLIAMAELQERTGDAAGSAETLHRAIKANQSSPGAYAALVEHQLRRRDHQAAIAAAQDGVSANPGKPRLLDLLGRAQEASGAIGDAATTYRELVRQEPQSLARVFQLAATLVRLRDFAGAAATLLQAQRTAPNEEGIFRELAAVYLADNRFDKALGVARELQGKATKATAGHVLAGDLHAARNNWPEAERAYRAALKSDPRSVVAAVSWCRAVSAAGRRRDADTFAKDWLARNSAALPMRLYVAETALAANDHKAAALEYETVLQHDANNVPALNNLAWILGQLHDPRAMDLAERAASLAPDNPSVLDTLGMLHVEHGIPTRGLAYLERLRTLVPNRKDFRLHYAMGLMRVGRAGEAKAELQELAAAVDDFPGKAGIPALLAEL